MFCLVEFDREELEEISATVSKQQHSCK